MTKLIKCLKINELKSLTKDRRERRQAPVSQKMFYKKLILHLGICVGLQGMRGNKRLLQRAGMLSATTFIHQTRGSLSQGF